MFQQIRVARDVAPNPIAQGRSRGIRDTLNQTFEENAYFGLVEFLFKLETPSSNSAVMLAGFKVLRTQ